MCAVCGDIFECWATLCGDPDTDAASWPCLGAPACILEHPQHLGIFPDAVEDAGCIDPETADFEDPEGRASYKSVEVDDFALSEVQRLVGRVS